MPQYRREQQMTDSSRHWFTEREAFMHSAFALQTKAKLHDEQSRYQHIEIYATESFGKLMVIDGCIMLTSRDNFFYHEMISHPVLFTHPAPRNIWIIGGGDCGTLREVLKHGRVEQVLQIEIDERVTRLAERYFPELCQANDDPRAEMKFIDGIAWVRDAPAHSVDIIIVDSTDPIGPAEGLFSAEFYRDCRRCLRDDGIFVQQSESPLYHLDIIGNMRQAMREAGFLQRQTLFFPQCVYPSGWWSVTMAGNVPLHAFRRDDAAGKPFATSYYNHDIHSAALAQPEFFRQAMAADDNF